ncbi:RNA polymerase sigma-70 factor, ECF subfamily [Pedobacter steynii]|uniref:RNA polymerase sigma-70 factor, ECF subfamily n=1 Tax=Pedobacter steynii TaxID=430522 RepID=A0A1G9UWN2_9SPHI|nr:RNA polymerase sigma factor [Pedobacter steynii]NQX40904.1 RNA polymerase sigma factor [Pedobacter steynii]SDM64343.1 RNA polymerase sigma-70 factor, ECF subfamily [Pedobacter steynii]
MQEIIKGCIRKDRSSQYLLYKELYSYCMGICKRYAVNDADAAEVLNNAFLKAFNHIEKYDPSKPFKAWMAKITANTAIDHYRMKLRFSDHDDINEHVHIGQGAAVYDQLAYDDLLSLIQTLSPAYRIVFNLYAIDGYSHEEIAETLNISTGTSKSNLFRARQKLQEMLAAKDQAETGLNIVIARDKNISVNERRA